MMRRDTGGGLARYTVNIGWYRPYIGTELQGKVEVLNLSISAYCLHSLTGVVQPNISDAVG